MSTPSGPRYILPTYQGTLNMSIQTVVSRFNEGANIGTWIALETLYRILVPVVKKEVQEQYKAVTQKIHKAKQRMKSYDPLAEQVNQSNELTRICRINNGVFFENIMRALHREGYLERKPIAARYQESKKLAV